MTKLFVFRPLSSTCPTFRDCYIGVVTRIRSYDINLFASDVGEFTIVIPVPVDISGEISLDDILWLQENNNNYWLIVRKLQFSTKDNTLTLSGTDLKGLFRNRITLYCSEAQDVGTFGYDVVSGTTGDCCVHYVNNNAVASEEEGRNFFGLTVDENSHTAGIANDSYMARFEVLSDVLHILCDAANLVWDIKGDTETNRYIFVVKEPTDKSIHQIIRAQVHFSISRKNISQLQREIGNTELKNVIYATKSGGTLEADAYTAVVHKDGAELGGIYRKEVQLNVSCEDFADVETHALHAAKEYVETNSMTFDLAFPRDYGKEFSIGDIITAIDEVNGDELTDVITAVSIHSSSGEYQVSITLGYSEPKTIKKIINKINRGVK